ncbi:MAG: zf-HC2 domain-containing protein [Candidatus Anammoxibacter sp.]
MNCNNIRKYFYAFIDGELDVERNIEILAHLDMCYECSRKIEAERILQKRVKETVCKATAPDYLKQKLFKKIEKKPGFIALLKDNLLLKSRLIPIGAIATILIIVASFFTIQNYREKNSFLHVAESRYHDLLMKQLETDIRSQDAAAIAGYIYDRAGLNVTLPDVKGNAKLVGAKISTINNKEVPLIFYIVGDIPVALYIVSNDTVDFSGMVVETTNDNVVYRPEGFCGTCQIIGWQGNGNRYVMVSKLNSAKMIGMITKV